MCADGKCRRFHDVEVLKAIFPNEPALYRASSTRPSAQTSQTKNKAEEGLLEDIVASRSRKSIVAAEPIKVPQKRLQKQACFEYFTRGHCAFGARCSSSHDASEVRGVDCMKFLASRCPFDDDCPMKHDKVKRSRVPCEYYLKGECRFPNCYRNHNDEELRLLRPQAPRYLSAANSRPMPFGADFEDIDQPSASKACGGSSDEVQCCICLCELTGHREEVTLACLHTFHGRCIKTWLAEKRACPLCRERA